MSVWGVCGGGTGIDRTATLQRIRTAAEGRARGNRHAQTSAIGDRWWRDLTTTISAQQVSDEAVGVGHVAKVSLILFYLFLNITSEKLKRLITEPNHMKTYIKAAHTCSKDSDNCNRYAKCDRVCKHGRI